MIVGLAIILSITVASALAAGIFEPLTTGIRYPVFFLGVGLGRFDLISHRLYG